MKKNNKRLEEQERIDLMLLHCQTLLDLSGQPRFGEMLFYGLGIPLIIALLYVLGLLVYTIFFI